MNDSISTWLSGLFGSNNGSAIPSTPLQSGVDISNTGIGSNNMYQTSLANPGASTLGNISSGVNALSGLASIYLGFQNSNTAKQQAAQAQDNWDKQWAANVKTTNASLSDRQAARVASNSKAYDSVDSYMSKYGIS